MEGREEMGTQMLKASLPIVPPTWKKPRCVLWVMHTVVYHKTVQNGTQ